MVDYESQADHRILEVKFESQADIMVYICDSEDAAEDDFIWYYVDHEEKATSKMMWTDSEDVADLKVMFVPYESQAGWVADHPLKGKI